MKKLILETTAPFQGLPELVAYDEGLFAGEGLAIEWVDREKDLEKKTELTVITPKGVNPFSSHGKLLEQGQADMYNACEWGNYCRVQDTSVRSRQIGRRGIVHLCRACGPARTRRFTPQQLAGRTVGVPFLFRHPLSRAAHAGRFPPRDMIKLCRAPSGSRYRVEAMMSGEMRSDDPDRALCDARREKRLSPDLRSVLPRHRGRLGKGRRRDLRRIQSRSAGGRTPHQCRQERLPPLLSSTITAKAIRRSER